VQLAALLTVGAIPLGWAPGAGWSPPLFIAAIALGTVAFAGLGLLLAGTLRAEATLALANGLFLGFLMLGGIVLPIDHLPETLRPLATLLPSTALADVLRISLASGAGTVASDATASAAILVGWAIGAATLAVRTFRWE
jgi:ABC-2 type transport system permease protein